MEAISSQETTAGWPFNKNAIGFVFGLAITLLNYDARVIGLAICMMWCTTQICQVIRDKR